MRIVSVVFMLLCSIVLLLACGDPAATTPRATADPELVQPTITPGNPVEEQPALATASTTMAAPDPTPETPTPTIDSATLEAELATIVAADLPTTPTPDVEGIDVPGFEGVRVLRLDLPGNGNGQPFWAVFSYGFRPFDPPGQSHFVAIYTYGGAGWREMGRINLEQADMLMEDSVQQVKISPDRAWLEVQSGAGAHSGLYDLLSFDGTTLRQEANHFHSSPAAGWLDDLNQDGTPEVVLNQSNVYVFCYACGVIEHSYDVLRWDGTQLAEVTLTPLGDDAPEALRDIINRALEFAQAGLWQDAELLARQAQDLNAEAQLETAAWNIYVLLLTAEARSEHVLTGEYPLLGSLFYGDYTAITGILSGYSPEELFSLPNPLITGTVAEGWKDELSTQIEAHTNEALAVQPDLAPAYFLRGWAAFLANPVNPAALQDVEQAASLQPDQPLFTSSAAYLRSGAPTASDEQAIQAAVLAYMRQRTGNDALEPVVTLDKLEGDYARVTISTPGDLQPLTLFVQRQGGTWQVIPGTDAPDLETEDYRDMGIPDRMLEQPEAAVPALEETQAIVAAVTDYMREHSVVSDFAVHVWAIEDTFAQARAVAASDQLASARLFLARQGDEWRVLSMGTPDREELERQGVPASLIDLEAEITEAVEEMLAEETDRDDQNGQHNAPTIRVQRVQEDYARALIALTAEDRPDTTVFLQYQNGAWEVMGAGTSFSAEFFARHDIPEALWREP